ncbi:NAD-dependent epimerase/dehydratase family protein [Mastigocoleus sp. MO_188.B34]|uniref:NAD-dependent epimerase/dehydratase family protein n=1 Tax=Mastigocoleus sp. MO_188.B34 TaxID=3036635 RepID=UPI002623FC81|nr:NAD-dependent epimerase/dehydratase family protein [Mastigocoleus sp. MO_188.B34]MDJ0698147.1 NAD-dependent epimerase/dehydratase family protein [Mastigocoleus sp. MO_188.B34]
MNVAIIGCGYVGSEIARHLSYAFSCKVKAIALSKEEVPQIKIPSWQQEAVIVNGDEPSLFSVLNNQDAIVLSFPGINNERRLYTSSDRDFGNEETYLHITKNLIKALKFNQKSTVKHLIFLSSCDVYGNTNGAWVNEDHAIAPIKKHIEIIFQIENALLQVSNSYLKVSALRLGKIYGSNHGQNYVLERQLENYSSLCGQTISGTGKEFLNWTHIDDIKSVTGFILQNKLQGIYNLVNDLPIESGECFQQLCKSQGFANVEWDSSIHTNLPNVRVSNQKLKSTGYRFIHNRFSVLD